MSFGSGREEFLLTKILFSKTYGLTLRPTKYFLVANTPSSKQATFEHTIRLLIHAWLLQYVGA